MLLLYLNLIEGQDAKDKFTSLYKKWRGIMLYTAEKILQDEGLSEDAVQEAFMYIAQNIHKIEDPFSISSKSFVLLVTDSCAKKLLRYRLGFESDEMIETYADADGDVPEKVFDRYDAQILKDAISALPEEMRLPLMLKYAGDYKYSEISKIMGIKADAARKRVERAKKKLKEMLKEEDFVSSQ